ncbi:hypothetical protein FNYG_07037 [Fusarium nygamai]|uniref:Uncharacterized protein n=1 Tax=Gibberella nygamai TaxID=42673 RepID=A0A2K0WBR8_GIBNY|nr:hypothetical protein FNYG_07037 [Fusarium nygamai]
MNPHIKKSGTSSDTPADDGWGAPPPATDDWQTPQPPIGDESDTSDAHIDDKSDLPAIPRFEVGPTPSGASLQCASYVIVRRMSHQPPDHAPTIDDLRSILDGPVMTERRAAIPDTGQSDLTVDQIAAVLQL